MSRSIPRLIMLACAATIVATAAHADDAKNPLIRPRPAKLETAVGTTSPTLPPAPDLKDKLQLQSPRGSTSDEVAKHLAQMRVVATIGNKAILRGPLGKSGNLALVSGQEASPPGLSSVGTVAQTFAGSQTGNSVASTSNASYSAGSQSAEAAISTRTITLTSGHAVQLSDGVWIRPEVDGESVRLYMQPSSISKDRSEALVYSSSIEIAGTNAVKLVEGSFDSDSGSKKTDKGAAK